MQKRKLDVPIKAQSMTTHTSKEPKRKVGRPITLPARLLGALARNGGTCYSQFQLATLAGTTTQKIRKHLKRLAEDGCITISRGPRGAHVISYTKIDDNTFVCWPYQKILFAKDDDDEYILVNRVYRESRTPLTAHKRIRQ